MYTGLDLMVGNKSATEYLVLLIGVNILLFMVNINNMSDFNFV